MLRLRRVAAHLRPLRASRRYAASSVSSGGEADVLFEEQKGGRNILITLNRPKALNALDASMVAKLTPQYKEWLPITGPKRVIVMKGAGGKAFCAGGDIKAIYDAKMEGKSPKECCGFFNNEYELNQIIGNLPSHLVQVAILNGITMGGGVGLSVHGLFRVATDNTMFAMPETAIGFFCDVGGSYFLPRLPHPALGTYLALTGARLKGPEVAIAGVATHYVPSSNLESLEKDLLAAKIDQVPEILGRYSTPLEEGQLTKDRLNAIERCFRHDTVEEIIAALEKDDEKEWAAQTLKLISRMSPKSLKVVHRQMKEGAEKSFTDCFAMEAVMAERFMERPDFFEGVRALLVDKDKSPKWSPPSLAEVSDDEISAFFK